MSSSLLRFANALLVGISTCLILVSLYYWIIKSETLTSLMVLVPAIIAALIAAALFTKPLVRLGIGAMIVLTYVFVAVGELTLAFINEDSLVRVVDQAKNEGKPFDARSKIQVARDLSKDGEEVVAGFTPAFLRQPIETGGYGSILEIDGSPTFVVSGVPNKRTVLCNESGEYAVYRSDEFGFNNPAGLWTGQVDVVGVGDSVVMGHCVPPEENIFATIRTRYPASLNLGFSGNSPLFSLASLVEYASLVKPRHVFWFYSPNDLEWYEIGKDRETPALKRYLEPGYTQNLVQKQAALNEAVTEYIKSNADSSVDDSIVAKAASIRRSAVQRVVDGLTLKNVRSTLFFLDKSLGSGVSEGDPEELNLAHYREVVERAHSLVNGWGGELYLVYMPGVEEFKENFPGKHYEYIKNLASELNAPFIDIYSALAQHPTPEQLYSLPENSAVLLPHMTKDGYRLAADRLLEHITASNMAAKLPE